MSVGWNGAAPSSFADASDYDLGTKYHANSDITITDVRIFGGDTGTMGGRTAHLFSAAGGTLATVVLPNTLTPGWATYALSAPVDINTGVDFWVTYDTIGSYGLVSPAGYPVVSADGLVTATAAGFNNTPALFPDTASNAFFGVDIQYNARAGNQRPVAGLSVSAVGLAASAVVTITDETPGTCNVVVEWGDGQTSSGTGPQTFAHTYAAAGMYAVMVTATDNGGLTDSAAAPLVVFSPATADPILHQICQFFGGPYVPEFHAYRTPTVAGVAQVRRGFDKLVDFAEFFVGQPAGTLTGCQIVATFTDGVERRLTFPAVTGRKHNTIRVELHCFLWSTAPYVEDAQDQREAIRRAIVAKIRTDPTLGSGGFEAGGFQVGEADNRGAGGDITWAVSQPETDEDDGSSKLYLLIGFEVHELPVG
jgi:PKD repeat protein